MVKASDAIWNGKIADFKRQKNKSQSECSSFFFDILQGFYEDISEKVKVELLITLQEYGDSLIQGQESAEQAVGSIKSILEEVFGSHHDKHYVTHCLVTTTTLIIQFDLVEFNPLLVQDIIQILLSICKRVNAPGETLTRKVACECLLELESAVPSILSKNVYLLFDLAKQEKTYMSQMHLLLVSDVAINSLHYGNSAKGALLFNDDDAMEGIMTRDVQQMASYIAGELNHMTPLVLWQTGQNVSQLFKLLDMPEVVLQNKMIECCYSSNLQALHLGLLLALDLLQDTVVLQDLIVIAECLLNKIMLPTFPTGVRTMCLEWLAEVCSQINFITDEARDLIVPMVSHMRKQLILDSPFVMQGKLEIFLAVLEMYPEAFDYFQCLEIPLQMARHGIVGRKLTILFSSLYLRFTGTDDFSVKSRIKDHIVNMTLRTPSFIGHTIDFIKGIQKDQDSAIRQDLIHQIASFILQLSVNDFSVNFNRYFPLIELACSENGLWPLGVVKWMRLFLLQSPVCRLGNWEFGSNVLSVCRAILANHSSMKLLYELADFLWFLHRKFNDQDISDRALFFYLIIGHASPKYFGTLFRKPNVDNRIQSISRKTDIEVPAELVRGILPTIRLDKEFLVIEKSVVHQMENISGTQNYAYDSYESYLNFLHENFETAVNLNLKIRFASDIDVKKVSSKVYALSIKFNPNGRCTDLPQVDLPYLAVSLPQHQQLNCDCIIVKVRPSEAAPFSIETCCTFTNQDGRVCVAPAPSIQLTFSDFFHPLMNFSDESCDISLQRNLFGFLWDHCSKNIKTSKACSNCCATSVKRLAISEKVMKRILETAWKPFVVEASENYIVGIFLAPAYHLLMRLSISPSETLVRFCMDNWKLLDVVEDYLQDLVNFGE